MLYMMLSSESLTAQRKRQLTYILMTIYSILAGIEYSIILPTVWLFLTEEMDSRPYMMGVVMTAYYITCFISEPIMGRLFDWYPTKMRWFVIVGTLFEIVGSFMYFLSLSAWFLVAARLIAGFGTGVYTVICAMVAKTTTVKQRTSHMSLFAVMRVVGIILGPVVNMAVNDVDIEWRGWSISRYTLPGIVMTGLWVLFLIVFVLTFVEFTLGDMKELSTENEKPSDKTHLVNESGVESYSDLFKQTEDSWPDKNTYIAPSSSIKHYLTCPVIGLMYFTFVSYFNQLGYEVAIFPLTERLVGWKEREASYLYSGLTAQTLLVLLVFLVVCKHVSDRKLIVGCQILQILNSIAMLILTPTAPENDKSNVWRLLPFLIIQIFGIPICMSCGRSLLSKLTREEHQGVMQGILRVAENMGNILGPIWIGFTLNHLFTMFALISTFYITSLMVIVATYSGLTVPQK